MFIWMSESAVQPDSLSVILVAWFDTSARTVLPSIMIILSDPLVWGDSASVWPSWLLFLFGLMSWSYSSRAVRSVTLNLANKFSQCTFSVTERYDLFCDLIILRQAWWRRSYDVIPNRPHRTDRETAAGKAQRYHTDLKLIYMLPIMHYTTRRQFRP